MAVKDNMVKSPPKGNVRFSISLSAEQKKSKTQILKHPYNFIVGKAGSGKTLLAVAKLARPIQKREDIDMNFLIRWDY